MRSLPMLTQTPSVQFDGVSPFLPNSNCDECSRAAKAPKGRVCIPAVNDQSIDGRENILVVFGKPSTKSTRVDVSLHGLEQVVGEWVAKNLDRPELVAFDFAVRCAGDGKVTLPQMRSCSPYLMGTVMRLGDLQRIVCIGPDAAEAVTGQRMREGFAYLEMNGRKVLVTATDDIVSEKQNKFDYAEFIDGLETAMVVTPEEPVYGQVHVVENEEDGELVRSIVAAAEFCALDIESAGQLYTPGFRLLSVAVSVPTSNDAYVFRFPEVSKSALRAVCQHPRIAMHNGKFDSQGLALHDPVLFLDSQFFFDTRLSARLLNPTGPADLRTLAAKIGMGALKDEAEGYREEGVKRVRKWLRAGNNACDLADEFPELEGLEDQVADPEVDSGSWSFAMIPKDILYRYNGSDTLATVRLAKYYKGILDRDENRGPIFRSVIMPAQRAVTVMERNGVPCDINEVRGLDNHLAGIEANLEGALKDISDINWGSAQQVGKHLFETLKLKAEKFTPGGQPQVDADALQALVKTMGDKAPKELTILLELRKVSKLRGTYASGLIPHVRPDGRIHGNIMLDGASSGRTSMSQPNLQNQPRPDKRQPLTLRIRRLFRAETGYDIVELDFSQLELRIAAALSGDEVMTAMFQGGATDFHLSTAKLIAPIFGVDVALVDKEHYLRTYAKIINFGLLYGKTDRGLADEMKVEVEVAAQVREAILGQFKQLAVWLEARREEARTTGGVWTEWGGYNARRRALHGVATPATMKTGRSGRPYRDDHVAQHWLNAAMNTPIQGSASDYCVASFAGAREFIAKNNMKAEIILSIHDAILFHCPRSETKALIHGVKAVMEGWYANGVPLIADAKTGPNLGEMKEYKEAA